MREKVTVKKAAWEDGAAAAAAAAADWEARMCSGIEWHIVVLQVRLEHLLAN